MNNKVGIFRVAVGVIIINGKNQVLLTKRSMLREHHPGEWEIVSGRLDQGEGFEKALEREVFEELRIEVIPITIIGTFHFYRGKEKIEHVGVTYLAKYKSGDLRVDGIEEEACIWLSFDEAIQQVHDKQIKINLTKAKIYINQASNNNE